MTRLTRFENKRSRAFIFTVDALFALALVSTLVMLFAFVYLPPARNEKFFELEQLGFDSLAVEHNETNPISMTGKFNALTGFNRFSSAEAAERSGASTIARARFYHYPPLCGCTPPSCGIDFDDPCLSESDLNAGFDANYSEVWVTP